MKRKRKSRSTNKFAIERLEDRNLLAADFGFVDVFLPADLETPGIQQQTSTTQDTGPAEPQNRGQRGPNGQRNQPDGQRNQPDRQPGNNPLGPQGDLDSVLNVEAREIDGTGNSLEDPTLGSADTTLVRATTVEYADGISEPAGADRPSAREISNEVAAQTTTETNDRNLTDLTWLWGQFIDHDIDLTEGADSAESFDIEVPTGPRFGRLQPGP